MYSLYNLCLPVTAKLDYSKCRRTALKENRIGKGGITTRHTAKEKGGIRQRCDCGRRRCIASLRSLHSNPSIAALPVTLAFELGAGDSAPAEQRGAVGAPEPGGAGAAQHVQPAQHAARQVHGGGRREQRAAAGGRRRARSCRGAQLKP